MQKMMEISKIIKEAATSAIKVFFLFIYCRRWRFHHCDEKKSRVESKRGKNCKFGAGMGYDVFSMISTTATISSIRVYPAVQEQDS